MAYFLTASTDYKDNNDKTYTLQEPLTFVTDGYDLVKVPEGFTWNGASIPWMFWGLPWIGAPNSRTNMRASCVHDYLYSWHDSRFSRKEVDEIFRTALICEGKPKWAARIMYWMVRCFGGSHYTPKLQSEV